MSRDSSGGGLWPDDDIEINSLTRNIGLWPQGGDDVPDETSPADALHNPERRMLVPYDLDDDEDVFLDSRWLVHAVISLTQARGHSMPCPWQNVLSFQHVQ